MDELLKELREIGEVLEEGFDTDRNTMQSIFSVTIGTRKMNDFDTVFKLHKIQKKHLYLYPILNKMIMNKDYLEIEFKSIKPLKLVKCTTKKQ